MEKLYFFDETFYWARSGRRATVIEAECELTQNVRPDLLRTAVVGALRVHRNFRARPVIVGRRFFVETSEAELVTVVREDEGEYHSSEGEYHSSGRPRSLGTKETGGLMLYVTYGERRFTLHVFHGLADMRSICAFLKTVLSFYCHTGDDPLPAADSMDTFPCHEHILQGGAPGQPEGKFIPQEHDIFHLPEKLFSSRTTRQRIIDIDLPLAPLLAFARENGSSCRRLRAIGWPPPSIRNLPLSSPAQPTQTRDGMISTRSSWVAFRVNETTQYYKDSEKI